MDGPAGSSKIQHEGIMRVKGRKKLNDPHVVEIK